MKIQLAALALTALFAAADACKCRDRFGQIDANATKHCCDGPMKGDDCPKRSFGNRASYHNCCVREYKTNSDCPCPDCTPYEYRPTAVEQDDSTAEQDE